MLVDFRRLLPCAERFYVSSALLPANMQAALSGRKARPKCIDEANAEYLITSCMLVARGRPGTCDFDMATTSLHATHGCARSLRATAAF